MHFPEAVVHVFRPEAARNRIAVARNRDGGESPAAVMPPVTVAYLAVAASSMRSATLPG
jgi:hypothetical protein